MNTAATIVCKRCGAPGLQWKQSKASKWYLTGGGEIVGDSGKVIKNIYPVHRCEDYIQRLVVDKANDAYDAAKAARMEAYDAQEIFLAPLYEWIEKASKSELETLWATAKNDKLLALKIIIETTKQTV